MEQLQYNLLFRWFVGLGIDDPVWVPTVFSKTGCPPQGGNSLVTVVIDGSDEIRPRQQAFLRNQLECIKAEIPVEGRLEVYKLGSDPEQILDPVVEVCNPGRGSDFSPWTHSPKRAEKLWQDAFQSKLQKAFDELLKPSKEQASAIVESVQSIGIKSYASPHWRDKTDRLDTELLQRVFLGWLRGERQHCKMVAVPTLAEEDAKRPSRERKRLVAEQSRIINRVKSALVRLGIRGFNPKLKRAADRLEHLRAPEGEPIPPNTLAALRATWNVGGSSGNRSKRSSRHASSDFARRLARLPAPWCACARSGAWHRGRGHAGAGGAIA